MNPSFICVIGWTSRFIGEISNVGEKTANKNQTMAENVSKPRSIQKQFKINVNKLEISLYKDASVQPVKYILNR